jgi:hypothetical protein
MTDKPRITLTYSGEMTLDVRAYVAAVEKALNEHIDVYRLVDDVRRAAADLHALGSGTITVDGDAGVIKLQHDM